MSVFCYGALLLIIAFCIHFVIWKIYLPQHQKSSLLLIFSFTLMVGFLLLATLGSRIKIFGIPTPVGIPEYLHICIFFISVTLAYLVTYSALEADSPSLVMVMHIAQAGLLGVDRNAFKEKMSDEVLLIPRIGDLLSEGLAYIENGRYKLTPKGRLIAQIFIFYRRLLKRTVKGG